MTSWSVDDDESARASLRSSAAKSSRDRFSDSRKASIFRASSSAVSSNARRAAAASSSSSLSDRGGVAFCASACTAVLALSEQHNKLLSCASPSNVKRTWRSFVRSNAEGRSHK